MNGRFAKFFWDNIPKNRCMVSEWSVSYFESRGDCQGFKSDSGRWTVASVRLDMEKIVQIGGLARFECFFRWLREFYSVYADRFWANVRILEQVRYGRIEDDKLRTRKIEKERVAIVYLGMNERCGDSCSSCRIFPVHASLFHLNLISLIIYPHFIHAN